MSANPEHDADLRDVAALSAAMRNKEQELSALSDRRAAAAARHQQRGVTYAQLAKAMGVSEVAVYKALRRFTGGPRRNLKQ